MADSKTIKVLLLDATGISSSMLIASMMEAAKAADVDFEVHSDSVNIVGYWDFEKHFFNVVLIAPQVRIMIKRVAKKLEPLGTIVRVIDPMTFGMVDGEKIFQQIHKALKAHDPTGSSPTT